VNKFKKNSSITPALSIAPAMMAGQRLYILDYSLEESDPLLIAFREGEGEKIGSGATSINNLFYRPPKKVAFIH